MTASNLQEIYSACHHGKADRASLVPSLFSQRVYHASFGWGRLWKWFYHAVRFLSGKDLKTSRLIKVMQKTEAVFSKRLALAVENANAYKSYLDKKIRDEEVDEKEVHAFRKSVRRWTRATAPLASDVDKGQNKKISDLFQTYYPDSIEEGRHPFSYGEDADLIKEAQLFIDLEGYLHQPLPLRLLKSLARKQKLTPDEKHELEQWVEMLNRKKKTDSPRPLPRLPQIPHRQAIFRRSFDRPRSQPSRKRSGTAAYERKRAPDMEKYPPARR